ncbi:MAG TPA: hypothetical protein VIV27_07105 [Halioglobus sp.]
MPDELELLDDELLEEELEDELLDEELDVELLDVELLDDELLELEELVPDELPPQPAKLERTTDKQTAMATCARRFRISRNIGQTLCYGVLFSQPGSWKAPSAQ